jgi:hypothetical protein
MSDAQDAARYRWLRQARKSEHWRATIYGWIHVAQGFSTHGFTLSGDKLDVIVDAAMREDAAKSNDRQEGEISERPGGGAPKPDSGSPPPLHNGEAMTPPPDAARKEWD